MMLVDRIRKLTKEKEYGFNHYKNPLDEPTRVVLVGEKHADHISYTFQGDLIRLLKPETIMHEFYEPNRTLSKSDIIRTAIDWINRWKDEYGVQLKPCDLSNAKKRKFHQIFYKFLVKLTEFDDESHPDSIIVDDNAIREMVMGKLIRAESARTNKPLIAIVGGYHVRPESRIHEELRCRRAIEIGGRKSIGYVTINQDERLNYILQGGAKFFE